MNKIKVSGEYYGTGDKATHFEAEFQTEINDQYLALSEVQNKLLGPYLLKKDKGYKTFRTCGLESFEAAKGSNKKAPKQAKPATSEPVEDI